MREKIEEAVEIIRQATLDNDAKELWAGFSGGHDSVVVAHLLSTQPRFVGTFHANTGIGVERTREYVRSMSRDNDWNLTEIATDESYDRIVRRIGFPGPAYHSYMYTRLKDRPVMELLRRRKRPYKRTDRIILATGIRNSESRRRMGYKEVTNRVGSLVWINPLLSWSREERDAYVELHKLRRNVVADHLGMSGECECGAYASEGELERIREVDAPLAERIDGLNAYCVPKFGWGWEQSPPRGHVTPREEMQAVLRRAPLCAGCDMRHRPEEDHQITVRAGA